MKKQNLTWIMRKHWKIPVEVSFIKQLTNILLKIVKITKNKPKQE